MYISANISYKGNSADIDFPVSDEMLNDILIESKMPTDTTQTQQIVRRYREAFEDLIGLHELHAFKVGFICGAELRQAISKTNKPSV